MYIFKARSRQRYLPYRRWIEPECMSCSSIYSKYYLVHLCLRPKKAEKRNLSSYRTISTQRKQAESIHQHQ